MRRLVLISMVPGSEGERGALIFVHGWGFSASVWHEQEACFSINHSVLSMDLRGHGAARDTPGPFDMKTFCEDMENLLRGSQTEKPVLVGSSLGSMVVLRYLLDFPGSVLGAVLIGSTPCFLKKEGFECGVSRVVLSRLRKQLLRNCGKRMEQFYGQLFSGEETKAAGGSAGQKSRYTALQHPPLPVLLSTLDILEKWDIRHRLCEVDIPVLIIHGEKDSLFGRKCAEELGKIEESRVEIIKGAGHVPFFTSPEKVNPLIGDFISSCEKSPGTRRYPASQGPSLQGKALDIGGDIYYDAAS